MWKYVTQFWEDFIAAETELAKMGIVRVYTPYGIIDYYDKNVKIEDDESKKETMV